MCIYIYVYIYIEIASCVFLRDMLCIYNTCTHIYAYMYIYQYINICTVYI